MALRADKIVLRAAASGSATYTSIIAESTDVTVDMSAEALETTSQTSALNAAFIAGKVSGTASGSFLLASDGTNYNELFVYLNGGTLIEVGIYRDGTQFINCDGVITGLSVTGGLSDALATGSYTIQLSGNLAV